MYNIPSKNYLWRHSILNWQINDYGYVSNSVNFRTINDIFYLEPKNIKEKLKDEGKFFKSFYSLISVHLFQYPKYYPFRNFLYKLKLQSFFVMGVSIYYYKLSLLISLINERLWLFLSSKVYRNRVLKNPSILIKKIYNYWNSN